MHESREYAPPYPNEERTCEEYFFFPPAMVFGFRFRILFFSLQQIIIVCALASKGPPKNDFTSYNTF
jgi:hypothetical protein